MKPSTLATTLAAAISQNETILIKGAPGVGKTDIIKQAATTAGMDLLVSHPVVMDPTDVRGLPWPDAHNKTASFLPFGDLATVLASTKPLVWVFDDLGHAPPSVQNSLMQILLARHIGEHKIPDHVVIVAATNRRTDRAGVAGILEPVKSRFTAIVELDPDLDDWCNWALDNGITPELVAFLRYRPNLLHDFVPTADLTNSPCPRTWVAASRVLTMGLPADATIELLNGAVGEGAAAEFYAFVDLYRALPNIDAALMDPENAIIPEEPSQLYAVATAIASKTSAQTATQVLRYAERLHEAGKPEFSALLVRDATRICRAICDTPAFIRFASGPLAELLHG